VSGPAGTPVPPIRRLSFRWSARIGRFLPCTDNDARCTMRNPVDALGRTVIADYAGNIFAGDQLRIIGYHLGHGSSLLDPADVVKWLTAERSRRRK
jgi:hypothetical protein